MFISINKKIISTTLILLFFLFSGINTHNDISAQMPMTGGDFLFEESQCRHNPGTGEVFCEVTLDTSVELMTQTVAPIEFYEGQGVWFQGCRDPEQDYDNWDSVWIERAYAAEAGSLGTWGKSVTDFYNLDPKDKVTHIYFRGNVQQEPGRQIIGCKYQFFTVDSPLVRPGQPFHNPQWEADQETQRMFEEAERIRREADRARAEEELLRAKLQAEIELQRQEEERKRLEEENQQRGLQDLFGAVGQAPVANIFSNAFQPPSDLPLGPYINLTEIPSDASEAVTDCVANYISSETGMSYEQAYMDFAYTLGVRFLDDPDFYFESVTNCMHLSFDKLLSGGWGIDGDYFTKNPPTGDLDGLIDNCIVPHLSNALNIPREFILDDVENVQSGKRSVTREEMLASYDCWITHDGRYNNNFEEPPQNGGGYETLDIGLLFDFIYGDEEIPGQNCMLNSLSSIHFDLGFSHSIVDSLVDFAVGRTDDWRFYEDRLSDEHQNYVINTVVGCNQELGWLRDYQASLTQGPNLEAVFARLVQPEFRDCIIGKFEDYGDIEESWGNELYDRMLKGFFEAEDPTEYTNRPLGKEQYHSIVDCAVEFEVDPETLTYVPAYLGQYTHFLEDVEFSWSRGLDEDAKYNRLVECIADGFENSGYGDDLVRKAEESADTMIWNVFYSGLGVNSQKPLGRDFTGIELDTVFDCLENKQEFEWIVNVYNSDYNYEPLFESGLFTQSNVDFTGAAADFRQTIVSNNPDIGESNNVSESLTLGEPLEMERLEAVNLARGAAAEDCMVANLAREKGETENYIRSSYIANLIWEPTQRPTRNEKEVLQNCESQIRSATQGLGGLELLLRFGSYGDPDYLSEPTDSQRACMVNEYKNDFGYMIESYGGNPDESAAKAISEISLPGTYNGYHPILGDVPNVRPPASKELNAISNCRVEDLFIYEGSRLRKLIPGVNTSDLPIGELINNPSNLAIMGILITLFFSVLQMVRGK